MKGWTPSLKGEFTPSLLDNHSPPSPCRKKEGVNLGNVAQRHNDAANAREWRAGQAHARSQDNHVKNM